ncbi:MAG: cation:proton antiporter, partial [Phycisphaerales bacterium]
ANQRWADVGEIVEFKENLRVLLISALFVVLAARLNPADLRRFIGPGLVFVAVLALVARPLSVWLSTYRSELSSRQRMFLAWMAPRGIVAAAVASVFTLRLQQRGYEGAEVLAPITFIIIIATVALYGLSAPFVARKLGVAESNPQGVLFTGAHGWARAIASLLNQRGYRVLLVDSNWDNVQAARMAGLTAHSGSILGEETLERLDLGGIGRLLAITPNDWINVLAVQRFVRIFGRAECYQLPPRQEGTKKQTHRYLHGRWLFGEEADYAALAERFARGFIVKASNLTEKFDYAAYRAYYGDSAVPLFVINESKRLRVLTSDANSEPQVGDILISLVKEPEEQNQRAAGLSGGC